MRNGTVIVRVGVVTVTHDCVDAAELLHTHTSVCFGYHLDGDEFRGADLAEVAFDAGLKAPGRYRVHVGPNVLMASIAAESREREASLGPECALTGLAMAECAHCTGDESPQEAQSRLAAARRTLRYTPRPAVRAGTCARCRYPYGPGATIRRDGHGGWIRPCCWDR